MDGEAKRKKYAAEVRKAYREGKLAEEQADALREAGVDIDSRQPIRPGVNDLATKRPDLAAQWHPTKNGLLTPTDVMAGSDRKVWWRCDKGHEWETTIARRSSGSRCPYCSNKAVLPGFNDLATTHPDLARQWHPTKNGGLRPEDVVYGSAARVWWRCDKGHEWETTIARRSSGSQCPYCGNSKVLPGFNDLATTNPELAEQWHPTKNGDLKPNEVTAGGGKMVWWRHWCEKTASWHEWRASVNGRAKGDGCPECSRLARSKPVRCVETGRLYLRIADAAEAVGLKSGTSISKALSDVKKTAGGFHWEYVDGNGKEGESE